jgi:hypothetical protein
MIWADAMTLLITFFAGLRAGDLWAKAALIGLTLAAFMIFAGYQLHRIKEDAASAERSRIERINQVNQAAADAARQKVDECQGVWNRETGKCDK